MSHRKRLPERRYSETIKFTHQTYVGPHKYVITVGFHEDGTPGEIFMNTEMKAGSLADATVADAAVAASLALQYGCPLDVLRQAMKRTPAGEPMGPLAHALDAVSVRHLEMVSSQAEHAAGHRDGDEEEEKQ